MKIKLLALASLFYIGSTQVSQATLHDRGGGLIYDDILNITWLQDANYANTSGYIGTMDQNGQEELFSEDKTKVRYTIENGVLSSNFSKLEETLNRQNIQIPTTDTPEFRAIIRNLVLNHPFSVSNIIERDQFISPTGAMRLKQAYTWSENLVYQGYSDWRLPNHAPIVDDFISYPFSTDGSTDSGYNNPTANNELAHLYYETLGNLAIVDRNGNRRPGTAGVDWGLVNQSFFSNIQTNRNTYWYSSGSFSNREVFSFGFTRGHSGLDEAQFSDQGFGWAVRNGDSSPLNAVPIPATVWLFISAFFGLTHTLGLKAKSKS